MGQNHFFGYFKIHQSVFGRFRKTSEVAGESWEILALPSWKSHACVSENVGRHEILWPEAEVLYFYERGLNVRTIFSE